MEKFDTINAYYASFPEEVQAKMQEIHDVIKAAAPDAEECTSYNMPAFKQNGVLVYYAAWKKHLGFYPTSSGVKIFEKELANFNWSKGTIQLPYNMPLPKELITKIVKLRLAENEEKALRKKK